MCRQRKEKTDSKTKTEQKNKTKEKIISVNKERDI